MVRNTLDVEIPRPVEEVFPYVEDDSKLRQWVSAIVESSREPGPPRVGAPFRQVVEVNNKPMELEGELTGYELNRELSVHLKSKMADMDVSYRFEPRGSSTVIHYVCDSYWHSWTLRLLGPVLKRVAQKKLEVDFNRLKQLLAQQPHGSALPDPSRRVKPDRA